MSSLVLHKAGSGYVGKLHIESTVGSGVHRPPQRVLIMDNSGSMGQWSRRMVQEVFPSVLERLGAKPDEPLLLILFSSTTTSYRLKVSDLQGFKLPSQGGTYMKGVFPVLETELDPSNPCVQLLALSDGNVNDQAATALAAAAAAPQLTARFQIEARAVRLFTSFYGQPDTRALASVLQLNTDSATTLVDIEQKTVYDEMASQMAGMYTGLVVSQHLLRASAPMLQLMPWAEAKEELILRQGGNTLWLTKFPEGGLTLNGETLTLQEEEPMSQGSMATILEDRVDFFVSQLKVLKVIDTAQAKDQSDKIVNYFKELEGSLRPDDDLEPLLEGGGLRNRALFMRKTLQRRMRSVTTMLENIANDDRVRALNQLQQAEYLRSMDTTKNAKALAKRAQTAGVEFDATLRQEIRQMKEHLVELADVDARSLSVSFYSQANTLDGIKEVCDLVDDEVFDGLLAVDLLRLLNVVGVPAVGPISDFPDPMTYRLDNLMAGSYISVADLSMVELTGQKLRTPGTDLVITNAIPVFEDAQIQSFLQRHAPSALEYLASIGMRRVLAEVPQTFAYSLCAGLWKLLQQLDGDKSELNITTLCRMAPAYHQSLLGRFDYLVPVLKQKQSLEKSFFISHNGITNCISPLWCLTKDGELQNVPSILRALYTFETFQVMRRRCRQEDAKFYVTQLDRLLGVDFKTRGTPLPEMFSRPEVTHSQKAEVNGEFFRELCKSMNHIKFATVIVPFFRAVHQEDPVAALRAIPEISEETLTNALDLDYPLDEFLLYNIVEGFLFQSKQSRVDKDVTISLRPDLGQRHEGQKMVEEYILARYREDFELRLKQMEGEEKKLLLDELLAQLLQTESTDEFCRLLSEGLCRGDTKFQIVNFNSQGCLELHTALLDTARNVRNRAAKLEVFYTGEDSVQKPVWNGGNMYRTCTDPVRSLLNSLGEEATWTRIQERYQSKGAHTYRSKCTCNRHGHSNDVPSYFAFGHEALASFVDVGGEEAWQKYQQQHQHCCGVARALAEGIDVLIQRLNAKRAKREACLHDPAQVARAIDAKKARRAEGRIRGFQAPQRKGAGKTLVLAKGGAADMEDDATSTDSDY